MFIVKVETLAMFYRCPAASPKNLKSRSLKNSKIIKKFPTSKKKVREKAEPKVTGMTGGQLSP